MKRIDRAATVVRNAPSWQMEVIKLAREVVHGRDAKLAVYSNQLRAFEDVYPVVPICAQWQRADELVRLIDNHNEMQSQNSHQTFVYITCWDERLPHSSPYGIRSAVQRLGAVIRTLGRCYRILSLLDDSRQRLMVTMGGGY